MEANAQYTDVPRVYNGNKAADAAGVSRKTIQRWYKQGRLKADRAPSGELRIRHDDLMQAKKDWHGGVMYRQNDQGTGTQEDRANKSAEFPQSQAENSRTQQGTSPYTKASNLAQTHGFEGHDGQGDTDWRTEATILQRENERLLKDLEKARAEHLQEIKGLSFNTGRLTQENQDLKKELSLLTAPEEPAAKPEATQDTEGHLGADNSMDMAPETQKQGTERDIPANPTPAPTDKAGPNAEIEHLL